MKSQIIEDIDKILNTESDPYQELYKLRAKIHKLYDNQWISAETMVKRNLEDFQRAARESRGHECDFKVAMLKIKNRSEEFLKNNPPKEKEE